MWGHPSYLPRKRTHPGSCWKRWTWGRGAASARRRGPSTGWASTCVCAGSRGDGSVRAPPRRSSMRPVFAGPPAADALDRTGAREPPPARRLRAGAAAVVSAMFPRHRTRHACDGKTSPSGVADLPCLAARPTARDTPRSVREVEAPPTGDVGPGAVGPPVGQRGPFQEATERLLPAGVARRIELLDRRRVLAPRRRSSVLFSASGRARRGLSATGRSRTSWKARHRRSSSRNVRRSAKACPVSTGLDGDNGYRLTSRLRRSC